MVAAITMRELQKMSAKAIEALPHTVPIRSGTRTVGWLMPLKKPDPERVERMVRLIEEERAARSPEDEAAITAVLREYGIEE